MERLRRVQSAGTVVVFLAFSLSAQAQDNSELFEFKPLPARLLPDYSPCTYQGSRFACFTAEQISQLNVLEIQARYWHDQWEDFTGLVAVKDAEILKLQEQLKVHLDIERQDQDQIKMLNDNLVEQVEAKNTWRAKAENPPTWPLWVGGAAAVLGLGAFLGSLAR